MLILVYNRNVEGGDIIGDTMKMQEFITQKNIVLR